MSTCPICDYPRRSQRLREQARRAAIADLRKRIETASRLAESLGLGTVAADLRAIVTKGRKRRTAP